MKAAGPARDMLQEVGSGLILWYSPASLSLIPAPAPTEVVAQLRMREGVLQDSHHLNQVRVAIVEKRDILL